jgi:hypothetical protein
MRIHWDSDTLASREKQFRNWSMPRVLTFASALAFVVLAGCNITDPHWCLQMEYGDCSGGQGEPIETMRVVGFPSERVDSTHQGLLEVGETVTLKLLLFSQSSIDTSYTATWVLDHSITAARVTRGANGAGQLVGVAPGTVAEIVVNGQSMPIWSCGGYTCTKLTRIVVLP